MNIIFINLIIILFPILTNTIYAIYVNKDKENLFLDISLLSSLYLSISLGDKKIFMIFSSIIFLFALLKKRNFTSFLILIIIFYISKMKIVIFEYLIFYLIYILYYKYKKEKLFINLFIFFKIIFILMYHIDNGLNHINILNSIFVSIIFVFITFLVISIIKISNDIINLNISLKELEKEKKLKDSLFKITHEIKNPIAVCKSYLDMFDFNNKNHEKYIDVLKEEINNILVLLQDFSSMSNIKINKEVLDINLLLENVVRQFRPVLKNNNIKFNYNITNDEIYINGDYNRLNQVLINVIKNSIEAKDKNKKSFINLNTDIIDNNFVIVIEDNGVGIEDIEKIKEPFYTTKKNGTGLGVSLSLEIIKSHNGKMDFISEINVGTKVIITLPIN